ncbi:MAG: hypothetical protein ACTSPW_12285 [Promethearchaeota archaeon]
MPEIGSPDISMEEYFKSENFYEEINNNRFPSRGDIVIPYKSASGRISEMIGVIIITNDCDILNGYAKYITFLPIYKVRDYINENLNKKKIKKWYKIITLNHKYLFFLPPHPKLDTDLGCVINFQDIRTQDINYFHKFNKVPTIKLKSPFIDRLCLKVAYLFNRIPIIHPNEDEIQEWLETNL